MPNTAHSPMKDNQPHLVILNGPSSEHVPELEIPRWVCTSRSGDPLATYRVCYDDRRLAYCRQFGPVITRPGWHLASEPTPGNPYRISDSGNAAMYLACQRANRVYVIGADMLLGGGLTTESDRLYETRPKTEQMRARMRRRFHQWTRATQTWPAFVWPVAVEGYWTIPMEDFLLNIDA